LETVSITEADAGTLRKILDLFIDSRRLLIQQGNLKSDNVNLVWEKDIIRITIIDPPAAVHLEEG